MYVGASPTRDLDAVKTPALMVLGSSDRRVGEQGVLSCARQIFAYRLDFAYK